jgi:hypothetical protein
MLTTSCPVMGDLARYMRQQDRDESLVLAIENEADLMLDDEKRRAQLAAGFVESLNDTGSKALLDEFHAFVGKQLLRAAFDRDPTVNALYPNLARAARELAELIAEVHVKKGH